MITFILLLAGAFLGAATAVPIWYYVVHRPLIEKYFESLRKVLTYEHQIKFLINRMRNFEYSGKTKCGYSRWN
jgi:hypothetical protein